MNIKKAIEIFNNISSQSYTDEEKVISIYQVMNMPTHMSFTKANILNALIWLWNSAYEIEKEGVE